MAAIAEAIHPTFAEYFRSKLDEGRCQYEKRFEQEEPPAVKPEDREMDTRLQLALLKILPTKMKAQVLASHSLFLSQSEGRTFWNLVQTHLQNGRPST